jgi:hypothetical protein
MATASGSTPGLIRSWLLDHERLIIVLVAAAVIWLGYVKVTNAIAAHDDAQLKQAQIVANQQAQQNAALAAQVQQDKQQLQALTDKVTAQNAALVAANTQLATALAKQQKTDAQLPPPELAQRWAQITPNMPAGGVTLSTDNTMHVTQAAAVDTVQQLEKVPVLQQQLDNETTQKNNDDLLIGQQNKNIFDLNGQITGLNKTVVDNNKVCQDTIADVKAKAAKSKRRWFIIGYVAGFLTREFTLK